MFASRNRNENAVYQEQQAFAAKPLNQGIKAVPLTGSTFATPANTRTRAPLGNKTTNAKATQRRADHTSPGLQPTKIKIHDAIPAKPEVPAPKHEERDIEYMPPREVPLPDYPDDIWPHDRVYPQLQKGDLTRGWWAVYSEKVDDDAELSDLGEKLRAFDTKGRRKGNHGPNDQAQQPTRGAHASSKPIPKSLRAKDASAMLSSKPKQAAVPNYAANTFAAKTRQASQASRPASKVQGSVNSHFSAIRAASRSTVGYSHGRSISSTGRRRVYQDHEDNRPVASIFRDKSALDEFLPESDTDDGLTELEDELEDFQLDPVISL